MGTLFNQPQHSNPIILLKSNIDSIADHVETLVGQHDWSYDYAFKIVELALKYAELDMRYEAQEAKDEQLAGLGELLEGLVCAIRG